MGFPFAAEHDGDSAHGRAPAQKGESHASRPVGCRRCGVGSFAIWRTSDPAAPGNAASGKGTEGTQAPEGREATPGTEELTRRADDVGPD